MKTPKPVSLNGLRRILLRSAIDDPSDVWQIEVETRDGERVVLSGIVVAISQKVTGSGGENLITLAPVGPARTKRRRR